MKKSESYFLKDGKLDLSLLDEEVSVKCETITYHKIRTVHERSISEREQVEEGFKEKLYGSLETYEILREMGAYLSSDFLSSDEEDQMWYVPEFEVKGEKAEAEEYEAFEMPKEEEEEEEHEAFEMPKEEEEEEEYEAFKIPKEEEQYEAFEMPKEGEEEEEDQYEAFEMPKEEEEEADQYEVFEILNEDEKEAEEQYEAFEISDIGQIFSYQISQADQDLMRQYEQPDSVMEERMLENEHANIETFRAYQLRLLEGRLLTQDIFSAQGVQVGRSGERITAELIERAKKEGTLIKIILKYL